MMVSHLQVLHDCYSAVLQTWKFLLYRLTPTRCLAYSNTFDWSNVQSRAAKVANALSLAYNPQGHQLLPRSFPTRYMYILHRSHVN